MFSPYTIHELNNYIVSNRWRRNHALAWIHEYSNGIQFQWDKITRKFVPKCLRKEKIVEGRRQLVYYWDFIESIDDYAARVSNVNSSNTSSSNFLLNYTTRATDILSPILDVSDKSDFMYGIELEYEGMSNSNLRKTQELLDQFAITKRDSSLINGFEICTTPASFSIHENNFKVFFKNFPEGLHPASTTGMHVHISRDPMSFLQLGKILAFMNNEDNDDLIWDIAGREENSYCRRTQTRDMKSYPFRYQQGRDRYQRVNLQNNRTIELRIFSTPDKYEEFMHKLEFCKSLVDYSSPGVISARDAEQQDVYLEFMYKHRHLYPNVS